MTGTTDTCSGDNVCLKDGCGPAFPNTYEITNISVTAPNLKSNGMPWDPDEDGTPDLFVTISVAGTIVATTDVNMNSYNATFAGPFPIMPDAGTALDLKASDADDGGTSELVYDCPIPSLTASFVRTGYILCSGTGVTLNATIHVQQ